MYTTGKPLLIEGEEKQELEEKVKQREKQIARGEERSRRSSRVLELEEKVERLETENELLRQMLAVSQAMVDDLIPGLEKIAQSNEVKANLNSKRIIELETKIESLKEFTDEFGSNSRRV